MHMINIRRAFAGITTGLALLLAINPPADAAPHRATPTASICDTGFRGQPAYDRLCLVTGDYADARREWKNGYTTAERRAQCRTTLVTGMPDVVRETRGDVLYDTYRNDRAMLRMTAWAGAVECFRLH